MRYQLHLEDQRKWKS